MTDQWRTLFQGYLTSSFLEVLRTDHPHLLPSIAPVEGAAVPGVSTGTTILALKARPGVVMAGDRRATEGMQIASRRIEKLYKADDHSVIAIAGVAGPSIEMARLLQIELEHYEKVEGDTLSLEGKATKLAQMIRMNLPAAMQGLVVVPLFAGYDTKRGEGRIFKYDVTGGRYEELEYHATGSGGKDARNTLKKLYRREMDRDEAVRLAVEALIDAAEEDAATGGPDLVHNIFPQVKIIGRDGLADVPEDEIRRHAEAILAGRREPR